MTIVSDLVLVESKSARNNQLARVSHDRASEILNKLKALYFIRCRGIDIVATQQVAHFYQEVVR